MNKHAATFGEYYRASDDPWGFRTRWYERRKRSLLRAALPAEHYEYGWEIGCSNGEQAATLAPVCSRLLASDGNMAAVRLSQERLAEFSGATVRQLWIPKGWPENTFDLIVLGEIGFYLDARSMAQVCEKLIPSLRPRGHFVACHWRPQVKGCAITGDEAHDIMTRLLPWKKTVQHIEDDFILEVWSQEGFSVAQIEGLR